ncbi:hypothetical protein Tco_1009846 [Tanacetum coccineum]
MAYSSSSSNANFKVHTCSTECEQSYAKLKKLYDEQREQLSDASVEIKAYDQGLKKVEAQLVTHQQNQLWYEQKIKYMKIDLDDKTDVLTYHKKLLAEAVKEKEELQAKLESFETSSKSLNTLLNSQLSANDKAGFGHNGAKESKDELYDEALMSVFDSHSSDIEDAPMYDRFAKVEGMHAVPHPMTGNYMPPKSNFGIDESHVETLESVHEPVVIEPKVVSQPKFWSDTPIIKEYESDSDDEYVIKSSKEQETPILKLDKKDWNDFNAQKAGLGYGFTRKAMFRRWSVSGHPINIVISMRKEMAKQDELSKKKEFPVNTARHNFNSQAVSTSAARKTNVVRPIVNDVRPRPIFNKTRSPIRRPFNRTTTPETNFSNQKVNTAGDKAVSTVEGIRETANDPQQTLKGKGIVDSGCSRHMTGNKAYLVD